MENQPMHNFVSQNPSIPVSGLSDTTAVSQLIVDHLPQLIFWRDIDRRLLGCNKAFANLLGFPDSQPLQGKTELEIMTMCQSSSFDLSFLLDLTTPFPSQIYQGNYCSDREILRTNQPVTYTLAINQLPTAKFLQIRKYPMSDVSGHVTGVITWIEDMSDSHQQIQPTQELLIDQTPLAVIEWDTEFRIVGWNQAAEKIFGYEKVEILGQQCDILIPTCERDRVLQVMNDLLQQKGGRRSTNKNLTKQGHLITCEWYNYPLLAANGQVIGVASMAQDISERVYFQEKLAENELFLRSVYDGCESPIFVLDIDEQGKYRYVGWNATAARVSGISAEQIIGKTLTEIQTGSQGDLLLEKFNQCVQTKTPLSYEHSLTFKNKTSWWLTKINPLHDANGRIFRIVGTALDISDRKQTEAKIQASSQHLQETLNQLQQAQAQLIQSEKMSSLGQLVAGVAHEINNPVNFIYGNLDHADNYIQDLLQIVQLYQALLTETPPEISELAQLIDLDFIMHDLPKLLASIKVGAQRIREIVLSLRTFSRMDESEMKAVNIHEGIDSTLMILEHRLKPSAHNPGIKIIQEYGELPLIQCYAGQLNQVFMNILSNGIDALEELIETENYQKLLKSNQTEKPQIKIITKLLESEQIQIKIVDNGMGIPDHIKSKLFDPFFTTKPIGKGTGMGLSISYKIITERHRGSLECISQVGQGTEFVITIPMRQSSTGE